MLIRSQEGRAYNVAHIQRLEIVHRETPKEGQKAFGVTAIFALYGEKAGGGSQVLVECDTQEEADSVVRRIVSKTGGIDLAPKAAGVPRKPRAVSMAY